MAFKKGKSGNPNGRPKGSKNRATGELRHKINDLLENQFDRITDDLDKLEPKERVTAWIKLLEYSLPKLTRAENTVDLSELSEQEIDSLIQKIMTYG